METVFHRFWREKVQDEIKSRAEALAHGQPVDFPSYREAVGFLGGLEEALKLAEEVETKLNQG